MLLSKTAKNKWNPKNKRYYEELGYVYSKMSDEFEVNVFHLPRSSSIKVDVLCDYCGKVYKKYWKNYIAENKFSNIHKDACNKCKTKKAEESNLEKYGVKSVLELDSIKARIANTNIQKYGASNPFGSDEIKQKICKTNLERYGVSNPNQNELVRKKTEQTCMSKYGEKSYIETLPRLYGKDHPKWKGGISSVRNERSTVKYHNWRKAVFERDNYSCVCCGAKSSNGQRVILNAHHILNWKDNSDLRYVLNNGITLCQDCHLKFHILFGKKNNTQQQLKEFLFNQGQKVC